MKRLLLLPLLAFTACKKAAPEDEPLPVRETAAGFAMIDYDSPTGAFSCRAPADWKGEERSLPEEEDVTFIGPARRGLTFIHIVQRTRKNSTWSDPAKYAESFWKLEPSGKPPVVAKRRIGGRDALAFTRERPYRKPHSSKIEHMMREDYVLIPTGGGFYELRHSASTGTAEDTLPVFEAVVRSFKLNR